MNLQQRLESQARVATPVVGLGGEGGGKYVTGEFTTEGEFKAIQVIANATFSAVEGNIEGLAGATIPAGTIIHGLFTLVTLNSGSVIIYRS